MATDVGTLSRLSLIENMNTVADALAASDTSGPVLTHFWFTGKRLLAYDNTIAISIPCETDFTGAVPRTLLDLLKTHKAQDVELKTKDSALHVKAGSSNFKLPVMPPEDFVFTMPAMPKVAELPEIDLGEFIAGLRACSRSLGSDVSRADFAGVTVIQAKSDLLMFSFDRATVSYSVVPIKGKLGVKRAIIPTAFCKQLLKLADDRKGDDELLLEINDEFALARVAGVTVFGRLVEPDSPMPFVQIMNETLKVVGDEFFEVSDKLESILERAAIITSRGIAKTRMEVTILKGKARFFSKSEAGEAEDFDLIKGHPDIKAMLDPRRILDGLKSLDNLAIAVTDEGTDAERTTLIMTNADGNQYYFVGSDA
jgi:DNA polymerase III sliding clamp (beta) subunit (PCNA family)